MESPLGPVIVGIVQIFISKITKEQSLPSVNIAERQQDDVYKSYLCILPYKGKRGEKALCNIAKEVNRILPNKHKATLVYTGANVSDRLSLQVEWM